MLSCPDSVLYLKAEYKYLSTALFLQMSDKLLRSHVAIWQFDKEALG